jgi:pilus assembly protein Flp/PilA
MTADIVSMRKRCSDSRGTSRPTVVGGVDGRWVDGFERELAVKKILERIRSVRTRRDDGASAVEYGLLVALIAVVIATTVVALGIALSDKFNQACTAVGGADADCAAPE